MMEMRVYYLTSAQFAISNIALKRIKISRFSDLNDPFELLAVDLTDMESRKFFRNQREEVNRKTGLLCFSKDWKSPLMWGHYADKHQGIALGFDIPEKKLVPVDYRTSLEMADINIEGKRTSKALTNKLLRIKFKDWIYENEVRLFLPLEKREAEGGMYFEPFSDVLTLREVILGPKCATPVSVIRGLVESLGEGLVEVIQARIAFSRFEVLTNRSATKADKGLTSKSSRRPRLQRGRG